MTETSSTPRTAETGRKRTTPAQGSGRQTGADASAATKGKTEDTPRRLPRRPRVWPD